MTRVLALTGMGYVRIRCKNLCQPNGTPDWTTGDEESAIMAGHGDADDPELRPLLERVEEEVVTFEQVEAKVASGVESLESAENLRGNVRKEDYRKVS